MNNRVPPRVNAGMSVREILTTYPSAEAVFEHRGLLGLGLSFLADPGHRAIAARSLSIAQAARRADRDPGQILATCSTDPWARRKRRHQRSRSRRI